MALWEVRSAMTRLIRILRLSLRLVAVLVLILIAAVAFVGFTPIGARMAMDEVEALISTPGQTIEIGTPTGLLTGSLRVPEIVLRDEQGVYARLQDVKVDWFPLALARKMFRAEEISAAKVDVFRPPVPVEETDTASEPFKLPVAIDIQRLNLPDIFIGKAVAKRDFRLAATGSGRADNEDIVARLAAHRQDLPEARAEADLTFVPGENRLTLKASIDEPRQGMLVGLLNLPDNPALHMTVEGSGPLSDWRGRLSADLDGNKAFSAEAHHQAVADNGHRIELKGKGAAEPLMPATVRSLFAGNTDFSLDATILPGGRISVTSGSLATSAVTLQASGAYDPNGQNDLSVQAAGVTGPVEFNVPVGKDVAKLEVESLDMSLKGPADAASLDLSARLASLDYPGYRLEAVAVQAKSPAIDLKTRSGTANVDLTFERSQFRDENLARLAPGPFRLSAPVTLSGEAIHYEAATIESARFGGTLTGDYVFAARTLSTDVKLSVLPDALPETLSAKLRGAVTLAGSLSYGANGAIAVSGLDLKSDLLTATGEAGLSDGMMRADLKGTVPALGLLLPDAKGAASFALTASGNPLAPDFNAQVTSEQAILAGRTLEDLTVNAEGKADREAPSARVKATGSLSGQQVNIETQLNSVNGVTSLPILKADIGPNHLEGNLRFTPDFLPEGTVRFNLPDIGLVAALAGQKASGDIAGDAEFRVSAGIASARINAKGTGVQREGVSIKNPDIALDIADLKALSANGTIKAAEMASGANRLSGLSLVFDRKGPETDFDLKANYDAKPVAAKGSVSVAGGRTTVNLANASASPRGIDLKLQRAAAIVIENGTASFTDILIQTGKGSVALSGRAGQTMDATADIRNLPISLVNTIQPSLQADGTLSGTVRATGPLAAPVVEYRLSASRLALAQTRSAGLQPLAIKADGRYQGNQVRINATATNGDGLNVTGGGSATLTGNRPLDMLFKGSLPFKAVAAVLAAQGFELTGTAAFDVKIGGTAAAPVITGRITSSNAQLVDVRRNIAVRNLALSVDLDRSRATISRLTGTLSTGGTVTVTGSVGIQPGSGFPADLKIALNKAAYVDGKLVSTVIDGNMTLTGPVLTGPKLAGKLSLGRSAITIPQKLPASLSTINVQHRNENRKVAEQTADVRSQGGGTKSGSSAGIALDLTVTAPRIFVQGRGIDAELGGDLTVRGTANEPVVSGGFKMKRGRMTILSRRLDFTTGTISFGGSLTPELDMAAESDTGSTTVTVNVEGPANDPAITFASSPALPQDEVLAQLIFQQSLSRLSALQIAQLADAAAQLAGGRSTSLLQGLRSNLGIDDLDITSDENGQAQVRAGKYLNDRTYIQIEQGGSSGGKASINLDVGRGFKLKGEAGAGGGGAAGIFYEKEY